MWNQNNAPFGSYPYQSQTYPSYSSYNNQIYSQQMPQNATMNTNKMYANGIEDVRSRQLPANSDFLFLDNDKPILYQKITDATGKMKIERFKITPYDEEEKASGFDASKFVSISDFEKLREQFEELKESLSAKKKQEAKA